MDINNEIIDKDVKVLKRKWETSFNRTAASVLLLKVSAVLLLAAAVFVQTFFSGKIKENKYYPYIVLVKSDGSYEYAGITGQTSFDLEENANSVRFFLMAFVSNLRTVSAVPQNIQANLVKNYAAITPELNGKLSAAIKADNPILLSATIRRDVAFTKFTRLGKNNYELTWTEDIRQQGNVVLQEIKKATFTIVQKIPDSIQQAQQNALGLYIKDFYMAEIRGAK